MTLRGRLTRLRALLSGRSDQPSTDRVTPDDLAALLGGHHRDELVQQLLEADIAEALVDLERPYVVVMRDRLSDFMSVQGPFDNGLAASVAAEAELHDNHSDEPEDDDRVEILVLPLTPPRRRRAGTRG